MFPDSKIAKSFTCAARSVPIWSVLGLHLTSKIYLLKRSEDSYLVSFDQCLNKVSQSGQIDIIICFWNSDIGRVATIYIISDFLRHVGQVEDCLENAGSK